MAAGYTTDEVPTCKARYPQNREKGSADYYKLECCQLSRLQLHAVINVTLKFEYPANIAKNKAAFCVVEVGCEALLYLERCSVKSLVL